MPVTQAAPATNRSAPAADTGGWPAVVPPGDTMHAVVIHEFGGPEVLTHERVPTPAPGPGEVLMQVAAVSVGRFLDVAARAGHHPYQGYVFPHTFGAEHAGVVAAVGPDVDAALVGRRAAGFPNVTDGTCEQCLRGYDELCTSLQLLGMHRSGAYAQYVALPARNLHPVPDDITAEQVAGLALAGPLAMNQLRRAGFTAGQWVLVQGGAGALGSITAGLALHLGGRVIATSRSAEKRRALLDLGVDAALDASAEDFVDQVLQLTGGRGADVVIDNLGQREIWVRSQACTATGATIVSSGAFLGHDVPVDLRELYIRGQRIVGVRTGNAASVTALWAEVDRGFRPVMGTAFQLEDAEQAHRMLEDDANVGRVVLLVDHPAAAPRP